MRGDAEEISINAAAATVLSPFFFPLLTPAVHSALVIILFYLFYAYVLMFTCIHVFMYLFLLGHLGRVTFAK